MVTLLSFCAIALLSAVFAASAPLQEQHPLVQKWQCSRSRGDAAGCGANSLAFLATKSDVSKAVVFRHLVQRSKERIGEAFGVPLKKASLKPGDGASWAGRCFSQTKATLSIDTSNVSVSFQTAGRSHVACHDTYLLATNDDWHLAVLWEEGSRVETLKHVPAEGLQFIVTEGLQVFLVEDGILGELANIIETLALFYGPWTEHDTLGFLKESMNITYPDRKNSDGVALTIDEDAVPDGTYLSTQRFDGSEAMIQFGTGSYVGHTTIALRMNGTLHVCESTGKNQPDYWPPPYGISCHPWKTWMLLAQKARYMVSLIPLDTEHQKLWDNTKAQAFVEKNIGYPYGFHNFLFGWLDTPTDNFPPPFSQGFVEIALSILDHTLHDGVQSVYTDPMNKRLATNCTSVACLYEAIATHWWDNMAPVYIQPEQDSWVYSDGPSMVCDSFLLETYKAAGVFGNLTEKIQATEFTPKDLYTLAIFEQNSRTATFNKWCGTAVEPADQQPKQPVCQIMGPYVMEFPGWNTITPYAHMAERCESLPPDYNRSPAGC